MTQVEVGLVADAFDTDRDGLISYWDFACDLRPERRVQFKHRPRNEAEQVEQEVKTQNENWSLSLF